MKAGQRSVSLKSSHLGATPNISVDGHSSSYYHLGPDDRRDIVPGEGEGREYKILLELRVDVCLVNMSRAGCLFSRFRVPLEFVIGRWP